jgi:hypothetical protein|uniref:Uncharacterized protein n=1 Tax=Myoviridae sp. cteBs22 TaxID=2826675 RepID=A0A8S5R154_9CAUD|nr:MAG TPA: hypothetical protein [Myoviridae sp. cteBs22]
MSQLSLIRQGGLAADIEQALSECVRQVCYLGKGGSVTIKISVKPATKNSGSSVIVSDEVNLKTPKLPTAETILFATDDGDLCESDPRQRKLNFDKVETTDEPTTEERFKKVN